MKPEAIMNGQGNQLYEFGPFRLDISERLLRRDGEVVPLTGKVFDLLLLLIRRRGYALSKDEIMSRLWPDTVVEENNLTVNMSALRKALGDDSSRPQYIETVPRRGYRFVAEVRELKGTANHPTAGLPGLRSPAKTGAPVILINPTVSRPSPVDSPDSRVKRQRMTLTVLMLVLLALAGVGLYLLSRPEPPVERQRARRGTTNPEADFAYRKARDIWSKRTARTLESAREHFERAINLDPDYALAWSGLADSYSMLSDYGVMLPAEAYPKARDAAKKALELDNTLAEAHTSLAWIKAVFEWDFVEAENEFKLALQLDPNYGTAHQWYSEFLSAMGRHEEAIAHIKRAQELEPLSLIINTALAGTYYFARQNDQAVEQCRRVMDLDPNFAEIYSWLHRAYENKGMAREALDAKQKQAWLMGWDAEYTQMRQAGSLPGMSAYWRKQLTWAMDDEPPSPFHVAECWAQLGNKEQAFFWLDRLCQERSYWAIYLNVAPTLDPLRSDPHFADLLRRVGLAP